jgi:hypothetical protein
MFTPSLDTRAIFTAANNAQAQKSQYTITADALTEPTPFNGEGQWFTVVSKTDASRRYKVTIPGFSPSYPEGKCNCQAWEKSAKGSRVGVCKHVYLSVEFAAEEAMIADLYEREEAREFMLETSREHNVGFTAEVMADTYAGYGA